MFNQKILVDYYKPKEVKHKEKIEEVGVTMKQMIHSFMVTALAQTRGGFRGRPSRGGRGGGRGGAGYSQYSAPPIPNSSYPGGHSAGMSYGHNLPAAAHDRGYNANLQYNNPPLPGSAAHAGLPKGPPPVSNMSLTSGPLPVKAQKSGPLPLSTPRKLIFLSDLV